MVEWGYKPSDVEQLVLTPPAAAPTVAPTDDAASVPADAGDLDVHGSDDADGSEPEAWQDYGAV